MGTLLVLPPGDFDPGPSPSACSGPSPSPVFVPKGCETGASLSAPPGVVSTPTPTPTPSRGGRPIDDDGSSGLPDDSIAWLLLLLLLLWLLLLLLWLLWLWLRPGLGPAPAPGPGLELGGLHNPATLQVPPPPLDPVDRGLGLGSSLSGPGPGPGLRGLHNNEVTPDALGAREWVVSVAAATSLPPPLIS